MRDLRPEEYQLLACMIGRDPSSAKLLAELKAARVEEMRDGGMGSLAFVDLTTPIRRFGREIGTCTFRDQDGVIVSVALNVDEEGHLFELDMWKIDWSPLQHFPALSDVVFD